jgi:hypothetical protein
MPDRPSLTHADLAHYHGAASSCDSILAELGMRLEVVSAPVCYACLHVEVFFCPRCALYFESWPLACIRFAAATAVRCKPRRPRP